MCRRSFARVFEAKCSHMLVQGVQYADLPYFVGLATLTIYIGAHRGLSSRNRQQLSMQQVRCQMRPLGLPELEEKSAYLLLAWVSQQLLYRVSMGTCCAF